MKVIGIIPARYDSSRFPGKPLADINGKSMITRVVESCRKSKVLDQVIVATDDDRIASHLKDSLGMEAIMTSEHHLNGTERIAEVAQNLTDTDWIINIQGDEPCIHPRQIDLLGEFLKRNEEFDIVTMAKRLDDAQLYENRNAVKVRMNEKEAVSFHRIIRSGYSETIGKHVGIYGFKRNVLLDLVKLEPTENERELSLEQLRWMDNGYRIGVEWTSFESPSVDVPSDMEKVLTFLEKNGQI